MIRESNSNFEKLSEKVISFRNDGYFKVRVFRNIGQSSDLIGDFISTKYFSWKEEFRDNVKVTIDHEEVEVDWNFHGLYEIQLLNSGCFRAVSFKEFKNSFNEVLELEIGEVEGLEEVDKTIGALMDSESSYYCLTNLPESYEHDWSVFDFFHSGFVVNKKNKIFTAVECGQD